MPSPSTSSSAAGGNRKRPRRPPSASEIARNSKHFETWATHEGLGQASFDDVPQSFMEDINFVFDVHMAKIPVSWAREESEGYHWLQTRATSNFRSFIRTAYDQRPSLFSELDDTIDMVALHTELIPVFNAWERLQRLLRMSDEKWTEADFVANVYNVFRIPAIRSSSHRTQRPVALPQPHAKKFSTEAARVLATKKAIPDSTIIIPSPLVKDLHKSEKSPFNVLTQKVKCGSPSKASSFRFQSTPYSSTPTVPSFEFISSVWEDKKPVHQSLDDAYRQNRMSTASAARHLHALHIEAPVFGLIWARGKVRAHVDWCKNDKGSSPVVQSAPYSGTIQSDDTRFHDWALDQAGDILQVHFLIQNIDQWTVGLFRQRVIRGVRALTKTIVKKEGSYKPWRRAGELYASTSHSHKENVEVSSSANSTPERKNKRK